MGELPDQAVKELRGIPVRLSGDDSPLADRWEETKEQVQHGLSFCWPAYLEAIRAIIEWTVLSLSVEGRARVAVETRVSLDDARRLGGVSLREIAAAEGLDYGLVANAIYRIKRLSLSLPMEKGHGKRSIVPVMNDRLTPRPEGPPCLAPRGRQTHGVCPSVVERHSDVKQARQATSHWFLV